MKQMMTFCGMEIGEWILENGDDDDDDDDNDE